MRIIANSAHLAVSLNPSHLQPTQKVDVHDSLHIFSTVNIAIEIISASNEVVLLVPIFTPFKS